MEMGEWLRSGGSISAGVAYRLAPDGPLAPAMGVARAVAVGERMRNGRWPGQVPSATGEEFAVGDRRRRSRPRIWISNLMRSGTAVVVVVVVAAAAAAAGAVAGVGQMRAPDGRRAPAESEGPVAAADRPAVRRGARVGCGDCLGAAALPTPATGPMTATLALPGRRAAPPASRRNSGTCARHRLQGGGGGESAASALCAPAFGALSGSAVLANSAQATALLAAPGTGSAGADDDDDASNSQCNAHWPFCVRRPRTHSARPAARSLSADGGSGGDGDGAHRAQSRTQTNQRQTVDGRGGAKSNRLRENSS